jgi:oxygen-independent coproporphyrinogen-3 oxidase
VQDFDIGGATRRSTGCSRPSMVVCLGGAVPGRLGFVSINADLIYGLPKAVARVLRSARIQLRWANCGPTGSLCTRTPTCRNGSSRSGGLCRRRPAGRLSAQNRHVVAMPLASLPGRRTMCYIGYGPLRPAGRLALASGQACRGGLHRNFQGYSTQPDCDLVGVGRLGHWSGWARHLLARTRRPLPEYCESGCAQAGPARRAWSTPCRPMTSLLRRSVIMALMCQGQCGVRAQSSVHTGWCDVASRTLRGRASSLLDEHGCVGVW